ncbi:MAG: DNA methyltransferase [Candidatus Nanoarchaeia archaeon]
MKYLFILGRNIELSIAEIKAFFRKNNFDFKQIGLIDNGLLIETNKQFDFKVVDKLGGVVSIGEVLASGTVKEIFDELDKKSIYYSDNNKLNYVLYDFNGKDFGDVLFYLKQKLKKEGLKATDKKLTGNIKLQDGEFVPKVSSKNVDEQYFIFENNFGRIIEKIDYENIEERDMKKPVRRNELSISPRLAKILINLSEVKEGETLLDPFCGIGVILEEALLQKIKVIGIDKDKKAVEDAKKNLKWFKFQKEDYKLISEDSSIAKIPRISGISTEPDLGKLQKKNPSKEEAKKIKNSFEELMIKVLKNLKNYVNGKIVFTAPLIFTNKEKLSCDFKRISSSAGLKISEGPINEFRKDSIIGRSIIVMEK